MTSFLGSSDMEFVKISECAYRLMVPGLGLRFDVQRLRWDRGELRGFLRVHCEIPGARTFNGCLSYGDFSLTNVTARFARAKDLEVATEAEEIPFRWLLEVLCQQVLDAEISGRRIVLLRNVAPPEGDGIVTVGQFPILLRHPSMLFGDGGTGKSTLALHIAGSLERAGIGVLLLDWELDGADHRRQLERLFGPEMPDVKYYRCHRPLTLEAEGLADKVGECGIDFVICDSVAFACDGPPELAEVAQRYFRALRQLGVGSLNIAHITKGENADKRPFGSTFWFNGCRSIWYAKQANSAPVPGEIHVGLFDRKFNLGGQRRSVGFRISYGTRIEVSEMEPGDNADLARELSITARLTLALRQGPRTISDLAEELEAKPQTLERYVRRDKGKKYRRVDGSDGVARIALVARRCA